VNRLGQSPRKGINAGGSVFKREVRVTLWGEVARSGLFAEKGRGFFNVARGKVLKKESGPNHGAEQRRMGEL